MRVWAIEWKDNHMLRDHMVTDLTDDTRTHKIFHALDEVCGVMDLPHPQWLESTIKEFRHHSRCRFTQDCFVGEDIPFDYLELRVLEED